MRLVFAGTPAFAAVALDALLGAGHEIASVLTRPDRPAGRGLKMTASEVKRLAQKHAIPVYQPATLRDDNALRRLAEIKADAMIVAAYGLILPPPVISLFAAGCINIHASLLPRWRGAAPIQRALLAGDAETGISIMAMDEGLDTGPVYLSESLEIRPRDTAGSLHDRLAALGANCIVTALRRISAGLLQPQPQRDDGVSYAQKIAKEEANIDWTRSAVEIDRQVRAFNPFPGAVTRIAGDPIKIWSATPVMAGRGIAGEVLDADSEGIFVSCGSGTLRLDELQRAGAKRMNAAEFLRGHALPSGTKVGVQLPV